ncbi:WxL domain-containing protein [Enterococcus sp. DIV0170]|uniref:WxL domain-containing protein n=1 Tax=Enterococcus sp. DIV0170 TaxID=2774642 RepID=UPI003F1EDA2C
MNNRLTKIFSLSLLVLLTLGEGSQFVYAVTEETSSSTAPVEEVATTEEKTAESTEVSSEAATVETTASSEATESTSKKEETKEKESKKEKAEKDSIKPQAANDPVNIPDNNLYQMLREILNRPTGANQSIPDGTPITEAQMEMVTTFNRTSLSSSWDSKPIANLEGIQYAKNLEEFSLNGKYVNDTFVSLPAGFSELKKLRVLKFSYGVLKDIDELKDHPTLTTFSAVQNELDSLKGLSGCEKLEVVDVSGSDNSRVKQNAGIQNFEGLEDATNLREVYFKKYDEQTTSSILVGPTDPEPSYVGYGLQSLEGLNCANSLEVLDLKGHPGLHTLAGLENYTKLKTLKVLGASNYNGRPYYYDNPGGVTTEMFDPAVHTPTYRTRGLKGANALDALQSCTSLETVNLNGNAIEDLSPLSNKSSIKELNLSRNLIQTLAPLSTTNNLVTLIVSHNLLTNLTGIESANSLEELDCSSQAGGANQMRFYPAFQTEHVLRGLLEDISAVNVQSLVTFNCSSNRLDNLNGLKNAANLTRLQASNNLFSDIKGDLQGCSSISYANFSNNNFVHFKDIGIGDAKDSLKEFYLPEQGYKSLAVGTNSNNDSAILETLEGLEKFTILETISVSINKITDDEFAHIPECIILIEANHNELQDKAFSKFDPSKNTRLQTIRASYNHISNILPLEAFTGLKELTLRGQSMTVPKHGGTATKVTTPDIGFEVDVLKTDQSTGLSYVKFGSWGTTATASKKEGSNILAIKDPEYYLEGRSPTTDFAFSGNNVFASFVYDGKITFNADYDIATTAKLKLVPTDINGNEITEIEQGGLIYWRAAVNSENSRYLMKPDFKHHLQSTEHDIVEDYADPSDAKSSEYYKGVRVEVEGNHIPTPAGFWSQVDVLDNKINDANTANITIVTKVRDNATPGNTANMYFNFQGKNFSLTRDTKTVTIVASAPEELNLTAPERFDFGKKNEASKKKHSYSLDTKAHSASEQTNGFKIRVTDSKRNANRTDWKVVGQLSDLTASDGNVLKNTSLSPKLSITDISLAKITGAGGTESATNITHGSPGSPTWEQSIDLTAGGASVTLSQASKADGEGVWDYQMPFDKVKLEVPSNVNNQAGYTFNGKITWTLQDAL